MYLEIVICNVFIGFVRIFLYIWRCFKELFEHVWQQCPRSVNNSRTNYLFEILGDLWGPKWSPPSHPRRQCGQSEKERERERERQREMETEREK